MRRLLLALPLLALGLSAHGQTLPARFKENGVLHIAVSATYPPLESHDPANGSLVGFDIDLGDALAKQLGLKPEWQDGTFAQLIPAVQTGRADMIISGISDLPARRETLDFIDYLNTGSQAFTLKDSPLKGMDELCGKKVGTVRSTNYPAFIAAWSDAHCVKEGKPAVEVVGDDRNPLVLVGLKQGRTDAAVQGSETLPALLKAEPDTYRILGAPFSKNYQGIVFAKADTGLRDAVLAALKTLYADGTYTALIKKWSLEDSAAPVITMNTEPVN
jgi:polar amino acid transport system substrate-binding protein